MKTLLGASAALILALGAATSAGAAVTWNWSFDGEAGTFLTDGSAPGGVAAAGDYNLLDFSVTSSAAGEVAGSLSGGQYTAGGFTTTLPYDFTWSGSAVTLWNSAGGNGFDWWPFQSTVTSDYYLFAETPNNINDPTRAVLYNGGFLASGTISVSVAGSGGAAVPEPAAWTLMIGGFGIAGAALRRRRAVAA